MTIEKKTSFRQQNRAWWCISLLGLITCLQLGWSSLREQRWPIAALPWIRVSASIHSSTSWGCTKHAAWNEKSQKAIRRWNPDQTSKKLTAWYKFSHLEQFDMRCCFPRHLYTMLRTTTLLRDPLKWFRHITNSYAATSAAVPIANNGNHKTFGAGDLATEALLRIPR